MIPKARKQFHLIETFQDPRLHTGREEKQGNDLAATFHNTTSPKQAASDSRGLSLRKQYKKSEAELDAYSPLLHSY